MSLINIFFLGVGGLIAVQFAILIVHHESVAPFIRRQGKKPTEFPMCCVLAIGFMRDYVVAKKLCSQQNVRPKWLTQFRSLLIVLGVLVAGIIAFLCWAGPQLTS